MIIWSMSKEENVFTLIFPRTYIQKKKEATIWRQSLPEIHKEYWRTTL